VNPSTIRFRLRQSVYAQSLSNRSPLFRYLEVFINTDVSMKSTHHCHRPIVFCRSWAGPQRAAFFKTTGLADTHTAVSHHQQSRLLMLVAGHYLKSSWQIPVSSQRCSSADFLCATVRPHYSAPLWTTWAAGPQANYSSDSASWLFAACMAQFQVPTYVAKSFLPVTDAPPCAAPAISARPVTVFFPSTNSLLAASALQLLTM